MIKAAASHDLPAGDTASLDDELRVCGTWFGVGGGVSKLEDFFHGFVFGGGASTYVFGSNFFTVTFSLSWFESFSVIFSCPPFLSLTEAGILALIIDGSFGLPSFDLTVSDSLVFMSLGASVFTVSESTVGATFEPPTASRYDFGGWSTLLVFSVALACDGPTAAAILTRCA